MKKILLPCLLAALTLVACQKQKVMEPAATAARAEASKAQVAAATASAAEKKQVSEKEINTAVKLQNKVTSPVQKLSAEALRYIYLGVRAVNDGALPNILHYENDKIYYMCRKVSDDMQRVIRQEWCNNNKKFTDAEQEVRYRSLGQMSDTQKRYIGVYDCQNKTKKEMSIADWCAMSTVSATCPVEDNQIIMVYVAGSSGAVIHTKIVLFDLDKKTEETIAEYQTFNAFSKIKRLSQDEFLILLAERQQDKNGIKPESKQLAIIYNHKTKKTTEIYQGETMSEKSQDVFAFDCYKDKIYLLMHKLNDGKLQSYLRTLDKNGKQLNEIALPALAKYDSPNQLAVDLLFANDVMFVQFETKRPDLKAKQPVVAVLRKAGDNYLLQNTSSMNISSIPKTHPVGTGPYMLLQDKERESGTQQFYAYYPDKNVFDLVDTQLKYTKTQGNITNWRNDNKQLLFQYIDFNNKADYYLAEIPEK